MPFRFESASCVVIGTFNIYIFQPPWLAAQGLVEEQSDIRIDINFSQPGWRFHFRHPPTTWLIAPNRLVVESNDPSVDCGAPVARILQALPHTPLFAIGNNLLLQAPAEDADTIRLPVRDRRWPELADANDVEILQRTFHTAVSISVERTLNLQVSLDKTRVRLNCNVHLDLTQRVDKVDAAIHAAENFFVDRDRTKDLAKKIFDVEWSDEPDNSASSIHRGERSCG